MTLWRMMFSLMTGFMICGAATAAPPALQPSPFAEGREPDPVARDFYFGQPPTAGEEPANRRGADAPVSSLIAILRDAIMYETTIPLGTVQPASGQR